MEEIKTKKKVSPPIRATIRFKAYPNEIWKEFFPEGQKRRFMVSNMGRVASFATNINVDGFILKLGISPAKTGARISLKRYLKDENGKTYDENQTFSVHYLVAENFIPQPDEDHVKVLHIDHDNLNNQVSNLKWGTMDDAWAHIQAHPSFKPRTKGPKLTVERVKLIKRKIAEGKTKQGLLAKQFGLSEMGIYRIKTGKSWGHVTI